MAVTPNPALHTTISADVYRLALKWWLGVPIMTLPTDQENLCPGCLSSLDVFGDHLVCCPRNNFQRRHAGVQHSVATLLTGAGQGFGLEVPLPGPEDDTLRPADILLRSWLAGKDTAVDITVETRDRAHGDYILERIREGGYPAERRSI